MKFIFFVSTLLYLIGAEMERHGHVSSFEEGGGGERGNKKNKRMF